MPRISRDSRLETREARRRLAPKREPYWRAIHQGLFIGYALWPTGTAWFVRRRIDGVYRKHRLGDTDDHQDANGLGVLSYAQATRKAMDLADVAVVQEAQQPALSAYTVAAAMCDYMEWFKDHRKSYAETQLAVDAHILPAIGKYRVTELTPRVIRQWHQRLATAAVRNRGKRFEVDPDDRDAVRRRRASANRILTVLKAALNHGWREGLIASDDAWRRVKPFGEVDQPRVRHLSLEESKRLVNAADPGFRLLVLGALLTGARYGELTRMQCGDHNATAGTLLVAESKGGKFRHIPLTDEGRRFFEQQTAGRESSAPMFCRHGGEPWGDSHQTRPMRAACEHAGINPPVSFHILRHCYGSLLAMQGVPLHVIAEALGHADTRMTRRHYAHLLPSYTADQIRANLPSFGAEVGNVETLRVKS